MIFLSYFEYSWRIPIYYHESESNFIHIRQSEKRENNTYHDCHTDYQVIYQSLMGTQESLTVMCTYDFNFIPILNLLRGPRLTISLTFRPVNQYL